LGHLIRNFFFGCELATLYSPKKKRKKKKERDDFLKEENVDKKDMVQS